MIFIDTVDLNLNTMINALMESRSSAPGSVTGVGQLGYFYFDTTLGYSRIWTGTRYIDVKDTYINVAQPAGGSPITVTIDNSTLGNKIANFDIAIATSVAKGAMSAADKTKLDASTSNNTASAIVQRDASGNFSAGTITATLAGNASSATNASQLNGQGASFYLARANHTGTQTASTISDFDTQVRTSRLDQMAAPTTNLNLNNQRIVSLADPVNPQDAATKAYVDAARAGLDVKDSVRAATTANITLSGLQTIDGVALAANDRVLVKNQSTGSGNGIYTASAGAWARSTDADSNAEVTGGMFTFISEGTTQGNTGWVLTTDDPITVGTTSLTFTQFSGATLTQGNGINISGNVVSAVGTTNRITVGAGGIDIASNYVGQTSITTLGTIATGTWNGTAIGVAFGGTGATTVAGARTNLVVPSYFSQVIGDGSATSITVTHNRGSQDVVPMLRRNTSPFDFVHPTIESTSTNSVTYRFSVAPTTNQYVACILIFA